MPKDRKKDAPGFPKSIPGTPKMKRDAKMACEPSVEAIQQFLEKQMDFQNDCFDMLRDHNSHNPDIEWQIQDGIGANAILPREKARLKLVKIPSFTETGTTQFPPHNTRLCDELVYLATKSLKFQDRARWYPYDLNKSGDINPNRVPSGAAPIIWAHGLPFFPVYKGYYILCGREHATCIGWLINEYNTSVTKAHPIWSVGAVVAPESAARAFHKIDRQMSLHKPFGQDAEACYRSAATARDILSADHHHCAIVPHLNLSLQVYPLWAFHGYNVRCGPPDAYGEATTVQKAFFDSKGLGAKYLSLIRPYSNIYSDKPEDSAELNDTSSSEKLDDSVNIADTKAPVPMVEGNDTVLSLPAETHPRKGPADFMHSIETQDTVPIDEEHGTLLVLPVEAFHTDTSMAETNLEMELEIKPPPINPIAQITENSAEQIAILHSAPLFGLELPPGLELSFGLESSSEPALSPILEPSLGVELFPGIDSSPTDDEVAV
ncbi:hypothetical protein PENANT_c006G04328 [Penicillium antarcticum]|uniref:Uncharacterized protein n=1 Tax=Penicillium antarcticum TaxID=416450 RepID=A0A1V6QDA3_9EURO|nr:uncharacterized protein N7508_009222 [Penicillium antarcticum]KAJ5294401.1 hypothetical protein N7508_009222 [Penicillium antarcticum]OQD86977.1 hypothetical protein PENANT_c006G04328 [Penicillium antarcticum]